MMDYGENFWRDWTQSGGPNRAHRAVELYVGAEPQMGLMSHVFMVVYELRMVVSTCGGARRQR